MTDRLDGILDQWRAARPDLDFSPLEVGSRLLRLSQLLQSRLNRIAAAFGLGHQGDLEVIAELDLVGPAPPSRLAEDLLLTSGGMTIRLNRLQAAGLVERRPNPRDGRGVLVHLTPAGRDLAGEALTALLRAQADVVDTLAPSDRSELARLLRTLVNELGDTPPLVSPTWKPGR